jgi:hypothetical protein
MIPVKTLTEHIPLVTGIKAVIMQVDGTQLLMQSVPMTDVSETNCQGTDYLFYVSLSVQLRDKIRGFTPKSPSLCTAFY